MTTTDPLYVAMEAERQRQDVSVQDWADAAGVNLSTVYKLIKGETRGMIFIARALAEALGMDLVVQPKARPAVPPGPCGDVLFSFVAPPTVCSLRAGHAGWHEAVGGASWTNAGPATPP